MQVTISLANPFDCQKMGIYKITFGTRFYIGSTSNLGRRRSGHQWAINKMYEGHPMSGITMMCYACLREHLKYNPHMNHGVMELIEEWPRGKPGLVDREYEYIHQACAQADCRCLNAHVFTPTIEEFLKHLTFVSYEVPDLLWCPDSPLERALPWGRRHYYPLRYYRPRTL